MTTIITTSIFILTLWWIALVLLVLRDQNREGDITHGPEFEMEEQDEDPIPNWPSLKEAFADPRCFVAVAVHLIFCALIWPAILIGKYYIKKRNKS